MSKQSEIETPLSFEELLHHHIVEDIGKVIDPRATLIGVPFIITSWEFEDSKTGPYVRVECLTEDNRKVNFVDGSTGIYAQATLVRPRLSTPILVKRGLRVSEYEYEGTPVSTYYFA